MLSLAAVLAPLQVPLGAAETWVTRYDDPVPDGCLPADCSLREAVIAANADPDFDVIRLSAGDYLLTLAGTGEDAADDGDLDLLEGVDVVGIAPALTRLVGSGLGEAIFTIASGQGVFTTLSLLGLRDSDAAAVEIEDAVVSVDRCELRDNGDSAADAGIRVDATSQLNLGESTIAGSGGAGVAVDGGEAFLTNLTAALNGGPELEVTAGGLLACDFCTIVHANDADPEISVESADLRLHSSAIVGDCDLASAVVDSQGGNLEAPGDTCALDSPNDLPSTADPKLAELGQNGGPTSTFLPAADSPMVGNADGCTFVDQRLGFRPEDSIDCEIGSVELEATGIVTPVFLDGFEQGHPGAWSETAGAA